MSLSRRELIRRGALAIPALALADRLGVKSLFGAPGAPARNIVFVDLQGGNDGTNSLVPFGMNGGLYYDYRKKLAVAESKILKVGSLPVGFHPKLIELHSRLLAGDLAVVHGVGYPQPNFSHDFSTRIWHSGLPQSPGADGWLGRYLSLYPAPTFPFATEIGDKTTLLTAGAAGEVPAIGILESYVFPFDGKHSEDSMNRRKAYEKMVASSLASPGAPQAVAATGEQLLELIDTLKTVPSVQFGSTYPPHGFSFQLKIVLRLMNAGLGLRFFRVQLSGFDTHADQDKAGFHGKLLQVLSQSLDAFQNDLQAHGLAGNTLIVITSEFGRTLRENLSAGTDHGTVNPVFVLGSAVNGGFQNPHPSLHPSNLSESGELKMSVDFRDVLGTLLVKWLGESPATAAQVLGGYPVSPLDFLS